MLRARARSQSIVEFGIIIVPLVIFISAGIDLGLLVTARQAVANAAGEGGRQAAYGQTVQSVFAAARNGLAGTLAPPSGLGISAKYCHGPACSTWDTYCDFIPGDPAAPGDCTYSPSPTDPTNHSFGDSVTVSLVERYEVLTPWLRPMFVGDLCNDGSKPCYARLMSAVTVVYPGSVDVQLPPP
jgi:TadE-like protein